MRGGFSGSRDPGGNMEAGWEACGLPVERTAPRERTYDGVKEAP